MPCICRLGELRRSWFLHAPPCLVGGRVERSEKPGEGHPSLTTAHPARIRLRSILATLSHKGRGCSLRRISVSNLNSIPRHCEERSDEAIQSLARGSGLLRLARNDATHASAFPRRVAPEPSVSALERRGRRECRPLVRRQDVLMPVLTIAVLNPLRLGRGQGETLNRIFACSALAFGARTPPSLC